MTVKSNVMTVRNQHQVSELDSLDNDGALSELDLQDNDGAPHYFVLVELQGLYGPKNGHFTDTSFFGGLCGQLMK